MPTYAYACAHCGPFTAMQSIANYRAPAPCPACDAVSDRVVSVPALLGRTQRRASGSVAADGSTDQGLPHRMGCACCPPSRTRRGT